MKRNVVAIDKATTQSDWETPPAVFAKLNEDFGPFDIDLTANWDNRLTGIYFGPSPADILGPLPDALTAPWRDFGTRGYSNPPYGHPFVSQLLAKAVQEATRGFSTTFLLPLRITKAFRQYVLRHARCVYICDKRICFYEDGHPRWNQVRLRKDGVKRADPAMFDSMIVQFDSDQPYKTFGVMLHEWHVPKHV